jgi:hypothetical protein
MGMGGLNSKKCDGQLVAPPQLKCRGNKRRGPYEGSSEQDKTGAICSHLRRCPEEIHCLVISWKKKKKGGERNLFKLGHGTGKKDRDSLLKRLFISFLPIWTDESLTPRVPSA